MTLDQLRHRIVQAPLAGGPSTVDLAVAVCRAGALGFLAGGYREADALRSDVRKVKGAVDAPFGVNLFVPSSRTHDEAALRAYAERMRAEAERYGSVLGTPAWNDDGWEAKLQMLRDEAPPVVSFTFGCPPAAVVSSLRDRGSEVWITVTSPAEAELAARAGADKLVVQGFEAGGHQASFLGDDHAEALSTLVLLRLVSTAVDRPLVAAGGIADGAGVAAALVAGADAVQVGTAFLCADEAGTHPAHRRALQTERPTAVTRAFSGRRARGLVNRFMREHGEAAPTAYPQVHELTAPIRAAARERQDPDGFNLWAGQGYPLAREAPAGEIVDRLSRQAHEALVAAMERLTIRRSTSRADPER